MKLKTPTRPNFSRSAKLCDQTFYHDSHPAHHQSDLLSAKPLAPRNQSTYAFSSVSREKRGNFRFPLRLPAGQFTQYPNHNFGKRQSPRWSFSKTERYQKVQLVEFEACERHPLLHEDEQVKMRASTTSMSQLLKDQVRTHRSSSLKDKASVLTKDTPRNYSIIHPRDTSPVGFFARTKIQHPLYLSTHDLNELEGRLDEQHYQQRLQPSPNGYIQFGKRKPRQPNRTCKGLQPFLYSNLDENQFNNYADTKYRGPPGHVNMDLHLDRPDYTPDRLGPNTEPYSLDATRVNADHVHLRFQQFRDVVKTRYDRVGQEPNTRLDYSPNEAQLPGLLEMDRMLGRNPELFPVVDPAIKKAGDGEMREELKRHIPMKEINEAHRPKNVENFTKMVQEGL